jgi:hypothetical protein
MLQPERRDPLPGAAIIAVAGQPGPAQGFGHGAFAVSAVAAAAR